jgi:hypothetical protein
MTPIMISICEGGKKETKFFEVFLNGEKVGEMAEFSDGWCYLHYLVNTFPKNEWANAKKMKTCLIKSGMEYKEVK